MISSGRIGKLAHQIAARTAVTDIASFALSMDEGWFDATPPVVEDEAADLAESVRYLSALKLIEVRKSDGAMRILFGKRYPGGIL